MATLREWLRRLWGAFRRNPSDRDLERELAHHLQSAEADLRRRGHSPREAARQARVRFGGSAQAIEALRDQRGLPWLDDLRSDLRFGLRGLARNPGFTAAAALTLSIGIGATAAMFSVTNFLLLRPFPAPHPEQLVVVAQLDEHTADFPHYLSYPEYLDYRERNQVFGGLAAYQPVRELLSTGNAAEAVWVEYVSANYFEVLQVDAARGRTFLPTEGRQPGDGAVVVLSHRGWQTRFNGDPSVVGRVVRLGPVEHTVIGVMPESFTGADGVIPANLFVPATQIQQIRSDWDGLLTNRNREAFYLMGRLRSGVTVVEARAHLDVLAAAIATEYPDSSEHSALYVVPERQARPVPNAARHAPILMTIVMALASLVLLIACANVGTLLIGRGISRQREMALRAGLGATRRRLVRQLVTESVLLSLLGGVGGAVAAVWATGLLRTIDFSDGIAQIPFDLSTDWRVFAFTALTATVTGLIAGLAPALRTTRVDLTNALRSGGRGASQGATGRRLTNGLVVAQVALSLLLLVCAGLFVRSGQHAAALDFGFRTDHLLLVSVDPLALGYPPAQARAWYRDIADEVDALPGVRSVSWARRAPLSAGGSAGSVVTLDGGTARETDPALVAVNHVDPHFFDTLDVPVIRGRGFRDEDATDGPPVAVISETAAQQLWPGQDPLGKRFVNADGLGDQVEVIGVVRDAHMSQSPLQRPPFALFPFGRTLAGPATLFVHTEGPPTALASAVTDAIRRRDPTMAMFGVTSMNRQLRTGPLLGMVDLGATVIGAFGALGLVLAAVGLYGVVAYSVTQRLPEFAIRTALGATAAGVLRLAVGRGMALAVGGLALGLVAAAAVTPFMTGFLVNVDPTDPVVFGVTGLLLTGVALLACLVPSRRAATADPLAALSAE